MIYPVQPAREFKIDTVQADRVYFQRYDVYHPGIDISGRGGWDTDLGKPVYNFYQGVVTDARQGSGPWGNIVRVWHAGLGVYSRYCHLHTMTVKPGMVLREGLQVGTIGKGYRNQYPAHLHFDLLRPLDNKPFDYWPRYGAVGMADIKRYFVDPLPVFKKFGVEYYW